MYLSYLASNLGDESVIISYRSRVRSVTCQDHENQNYSLAVKLAKSPRVSLLFVSISSQDFCMKFHIGLFSVISVFQKKLEFLAPITREY